MKIFRIKRQLNHVSAGGGGTTVIVNCGCGCGCEDCPCAVTGQIDPAVEEEPLLHYTVNPANGTGPYTYDWTLAQNAPIAGYVLPTFDGATNTQNVALALPLGDGSAMGLLQCKITDANGNVGYAYYMALINIPT